MNPINPRFLSSMYRKETIPSFLVTIGLVNVAIGGIGDRVGLLSFGIVTVGSAIAWRWWPQKSPKQPSQPLAQTYLPPASSNSVPPLATSKRERKS